MALLNFGVTLKKVKKNSISVCEFFFFFFPFLFFKRPTVSGRCMRGDEEPQGQPLSQSDFFFFLKKKASQMGVHKHFSTVKQKREKGERGSGRGEGREGRQRREKGRERRDSILECPVAIKCCH